MVFSSDNKAAHLICWVFMWLTRPTQGLHVRLQLEQGSVYSSATSYCPCDSVNQWFSAVTTKQHISSVVGFHVAHKPNSGFTRPFTVRTGICWQFSLVPMAAVHLSQVSLHQELIFFFFLSLAAGLPMTHSLHIFDALEPIFTPFKFVLCVELTPLGYIYMFIPQWLTL